LSNITFNVTDVDNPLIDLTTMLVSSSNTALLPESEIILSSSGGTYQLSITPEKDECGQSTITISATDGALMTTMSFEVDVKEPNEAPVISEIVDQQIGQGGTLENLTLIIMDVDDDLEDLEVTVSSSNTTLVAESDISILLSEDVYLLTLSSQEGQLGQTVISVNVTDGQLTSFATFTLTVVEQVSVLDSDDELNNATIVFPNPTTNKLNVTVPKDALLQRVSIYDMEGKELLIDLLQNDDSSLEYDISGYLDGIYLMEITTKNSVIHKRFIKK